MIKKITLLLILCCIIVSCGKKGDPTYNDPKKEAQIKSFSIIKV
tara:strand:- start:1228 stop:1359 length:132 start_codon:yes stop_codon:yes gene_type:complete